MNIYVSNLDSSVNNDTLKDIFSPYGEVLSAEVSYDAFTGGSRGFGHVEMDDDAAKNAISKLNNSQVKSKTISVEEAVPKPVHKGSYKVGSGPVNLYKFKKN